MRRALLSVLLLAGTAASVGAIPAVGRSAGPRAHRAAAPAHLQVTQVEYRLLLSRGSVRAGTLDLEEIDGGMDPHDLRLRRQGSGSTVYGRLLTPGRRWDGVVHLSPGVYTLWCSLPEHAKLGMHATLRVTG
jgi:hypothetical protein